jgi:hypothetical protein
MSKVEQSLPSRRDFIRLSSGALVIATLGNAGDLHAASAQSIPAASVGFWPGIPKAARRFRSSALPYLVPAESILAGDPAFFSAGARAFVRGVWRTEAARDRAAAFALDVMYDADGGKVPFHAWSFAARSVDSPAFGSSRLAFNVPVDAQGTLDLVLSAPEGPRTIKFSVNSAPDSLKLRPGYYFFALPEGPNQQDIDWTRVRIRDGAVPHQIEPHGPGVLSMGSFAGQEESVPFSYLVLSVEVGSQPLR